MSIAYCHYMFDILYYLHAHPVYVYITLYYISHAV